SGSVRANHHREPGEQSPIEAGYIDADCDFDPNIPLAVRRRTIHSSLSRNGTVQRAYLPTQGFDEAADILCGLADEVPDAGVREERELEDGYCGGEGAGRLEDQAHQFRVVGEEEDVAHEAADGVGGFDGGDAILGGFGQQVEG